MRCPVSLVLNTAERKRPVPYSAAEYWEKLHERNGLSAVGQSALPDAINKWLYRRLAGNLRAFIKRHHVHARPGDRALEVGVGKGYWVTFWERLGWNTDGFDLIASAVEDVQQHHPNGRFWVADVSQPGGLGADEVQPRWSLVTCMNVLLHVTHDEPFNRSLANVAAAVAPGGYLLLAEPILTTTTVELPYHPNKHSRARVLASYVSPLIALGLELVAVEHGCVLANNPIEAGSKKAMARYRSWWNWIARRSKVKPRSARWLGPLVYVLDWVAMRTSAAPTTKFALLRRPTRADQEHC
jgi:2-polyprenyl-3-methyl-5-hydroxy-6-metoxy-1,4-benzoquinol methylase